MLPAGQARARGTGRALTSRVIIEQGKGKPAERLGLDMDQAFTPLRDSATAHDRRLSDRTQAFTDGSETLTGLAAGPPWLVAAPAGNA